MSSTTTLATAEQIAALIECVADPADIVELRMIDRSLPQKHPNKVRHKWVKAPEVAGMADGLLTINSGGVDVYFGANPRPHTGAKTDESIQVARCLFADFDGGATFDAVAEKIGAAMLPWPTAIVSTGHGIHAYWRMDVPCTDLAAWREMQRDLIHTLGSDDKIHNPERVMRLPGFTNHKPPVAHAELIEADASRVYGWEDVLCALRQRPRTEQPKPTGDVPPATPADHATLRIATVAMMMIEKPDGNDGSNRLYAYACRAVEFNLCDADAVKAVRAAESLRPFPRAYSDADILRRVRDAEKAVERGSGVKTPDDEGSNGGIGSASNVSTSKPRAQYRTFPTHLLPRRMGGIVGAGSASIGCDPAYLALPALAGTAGLIGNTRKAVVKRGWIEHAIIWAMPVGKSGTAKSPAADIILAPFDEMHRHAMKTAEKEQKEYETAMKQYEADFAIWKRKAQGEMPAEPEPPASQRLLVDDVTIESLAVLLKNNPRGLFLNRDELAGWIGGFDRYAQNGGGDIARWLSIHIAKSITVDRKTTKPVFVPCPAISVFGGIQPDRLPKVITPTMRDTGLLARILMAYPPPAPKLFNGEDLDARAVREWRELLVDLSSLRMAKNEDGDDTAVFVGMSMDAQRLFGEWADAHNAASVRKPSEVASARAKLEGYAVRFALIFAVCEGREQISREDIANGTALADWFAYEAERIYDAIGSTDEDRESAELARWIESRGNRTTMRELMNSGPRSYRGKKEIAEAALDRLVELGRAKWQDTPGGKGGRPTKHCVLTDVEIHDGYVGSGNETPDDDSETRGFDAKQGANHAA